MWIIVVLPDGMANPQTFGDKNGKPFPSEHAAEQAARVFPRRGTSYSVYVTQIGSI